MNRTTCVAACTALLFTAGVAPLHAAAAPQPDWKAPRGGVAPQPDWKAPRTSVAPGPVRYAPWAGRSAGPMPTHKMPTHKITVDVLDRGGKTPATGDAPLVIFTSLDGKRYHNRPLTNGHMAGELPAGEYVVATWVYTAGRAGRKSLTIVYRPRLVLNGDRSVTLDARQGRPVSVQVDHPGARVVKGAGEGRIVQRIGRKVVTTLDFLFEGRAVFVTPTGRAAGLALFLQAPLTKGGAVEGSPYTYNVVGPVSTQNQIPADPALRVRTKDLATVRTRYAAQGRPGCAGTHTGAKFPGGGWDTAFYVGIGKLPVTRTVYFSPRTDWDVDYGVTAPDCGFTEWSSLGGKVRFPRAGSYAQDPLIGPYGPGRDWNSRYQDGRAQFWVPMFSSSRFPSGIAPYSGTTGQTTLRDATGKVIGKSDQPGHGEFQLPPERQAYRVTTDAHRQIPWSDLAVRQHVEWTFTSGAPSGEWAHMPLLAVLYRTPLDANNRAKRGTAQRIDLAATSSDGTPRPKIRKLTLQVSFDDGKTWQRIPVRQTDTGGTATVHSPNNPQANHVSLRTFAQDDTGRTVDHTVIHAYGLTN